MATVNINAADAAYLDDHIEVADKFAQKAAEYRTLVARTEQKLTGAGGVHSVGDRVRAGIVRQNPAADGALETQLTDVALERDGGGVIVKMHTNAEAVAYRASLA